MNLKQALRKIEQLETSLEQSKQANKRIKAECRYIDYNRLLTRFNRQKEENMTMMIDKDKQIDELITIALWAIRRLPTNGQKHFAYHDLQKVVEKDNKYREFIDKCKNEVPIDLLKEG